ncbi:hypothetical protein BDZ89DRAFT_1135404 [Hymenopellis radicata]|nr:hypothetical protein BDZ89DRAFT_1135404 [Hymenopellis radicata]
MSVSLKKRKGLFVCPSIPVRFTQPDDRPQDFVQFSLYIARTLTLTAAESEELQRTAQLPTLNHFLIWLAGRMIRMETKIDAVQPPDIQFIIPSGLSAKIEEKSVRVFLDTTIGGYKTRPKDKLISLLKSNRSWGLTRQVEESTNAMKTIGKKINQRFTHHRNDAKDKIAASFGSWDDDSKTFTGPSKNIYDLTKDVMTAVGGKSFSMEITLPLVTRVALMRYVYDRQLKKTLNGKVASDFWDLVDTKLKKIREEKGSDKAKISEAFGKLLKADRKTWGTITAEELQQLPLTAITVDEMEG